MKFTIDGDLYENFRSECIRCDAWYDDIGSFLSWKDTFELMGFTTYEDGDSLNHTLSDEEYVWFMLRFQ